MWRWTWSAAPETTPMRSEERGGPLIIGRDWNPTPGEPCASCGVRPDVACQHRPASGGLPIALREDGESKAKRKRDYSGTGHNFRARRS